MIVNQDVIADCQQDGGGLQSVSTTERHIKPGNVTEFLQLSTNLTDFTKEQDLNKVNTNVCCVIIFKIKMFLVLNYMIVKANTEDSLL